MIGLEKLYSSYILISTEIVDIDTDRFDKIGEAACFLLVFLAVGCK